MTRHRLGRRALHPDPRRSQRDPRDFYHGLIGEYRGQKFSVEVFSGYPLRDVAVSRGLLNDRRYTRSGITRAGITG